MSDVQQLWDLLGDVPIDEDECIEEPFLEFPSGTRRWEIWRWFEEAHDVSVLELMYGGHDE